jgi:hypothetical protein
MTWGRECWDARNVFARGIFDTSRRMQYLMPLPMNIRRGGQGREVWTDQPRKLGRSCIEITLMVQHEAAGVKLGGGCVYAT